MSFRGDENRYREHTVASITVLLQEFAAVIPTASLSYVRIASFRQQ